MLSSPLLLLSLYQRHLPLSSKSMKHLTYLTIYAIETETGHIPVDVVGNGPCKEENEPFSCVCQKKEEV